MKNKLIVLESIKQQNSKDGLKICFELKIGGRKNTLWYNISGEHVIKKVPEVFDAIVVTFLWYAIRYGYNFSSKNYPISEKLLYQLTYHVIPQFVKCNPEIAKTIEIEAPITKEIMKNRCNFVATGVSCGVDSMTTIYEYTRQCKLNDYKLTHLVYFKVGAHDGQIGRFDREIEDELFNKQYKNAENFAKKINLPIVIVDSNLNEILADFFGFVDYDRTHTYRNCGVMIMLQNYFSKYYYADTYGLDSFSLNMDGDSAHYEKWLLPLLSTDEINFYSANQGMNRFEKTNYITNYKPSYDSLLVCWLSDKNCGECDKCIRTMVTLDLLGKLELYKASFDIEKYCKDKKKALKRVIFNRKSDQFFSEIYSYMPLTRRERVRYELANIVRRVKNKFC